MRVNVNGFFLGEDLILKTRSEF